MANIRDVAKKAGVSVATVSRVLNRASNVSPKTANAVLSAMQELRFTPNGLARGLALNRTRTIALLIPNIVNPLYPEMAKGVEDVAHQKGYNVLLCNTEEKVEKERDYLAMLIERRVDGFILMSTLLTNNDLLQIREHNIPFVLTGRYHQDLNADIVYTDYAYGSYLVVHHLLEAGYQRIAHISGSAAQWESREKLSGFEKALREAQLAIETKYIVEGDNEIEGGYLGTIRLLHLSEKPQAIFAANDLMAIGAIDAIKAQGLRVPSDVAVVGFDDIRMSTLVEPKLTTVSNPVHKMGLIGARLLFDHIDNGAGEDATQKILLQPKLMVRRSCGHENRLREIFN